jgi:hypothetical protein
MVGLPTPAGRLTKRQQAAGHDRNANQASDKVSGLKSPGPIIPGCANENIALGYDLCMAGGDAHNGDRTKEIPDEDSMANRSARANPTIIV